MAIDLLSTSSFLAADFKLPRDQCKSLRSIPNYFPPLPPKYTYLHTPAVKPTEAIRKELLAKGWQEWQRDHQDVNELMAQSDDEEEPNEPEEEKVEGEENLIKFLLKTRSKQKMVIKCNIPVIKRAPQPTSESDKLQGKSKSFEIRGVPVPDDKDYEVLVPEPKARPYKDALQLEGDPGDRFRNG